MQSLIAGALMLLAAAVSVAAQQAPPAAGGGKSTDDSAANCGMIYGRNHFLTVCAPDGWTLDNGIMNDQGIYAVFYPNGSNWEQAKEKGTILYINVVERPEGSTVEKMMADDADEVRHGAPSAVVKQGDPIRIGDLSAPVLRYEPGGFNRYEAVAYIGEEKVLVMFVISSHSQKKLNKDFPAFEQLVQSYKFLSSNVTVEQK